MLATIRKKKASKKKANVESVLTAARKLSIEEQAAVIVALQSQQPSEIPFSAEWIAEINRRSDELDRGKSKLIPWEATKRRLQARLDG